MRLCAMRCAAWPFTFFSGAGMGPVMMLTCHTRECLTTHPQPLFGLASSAPSAARRAGPVPRRPPTPRRGRPADPDGRVALSVPLVSQ